MERRAVMLEHLMFRLVKYLMFSGTCFFFGIGIGPSDAEKQEAGATRNLASFATSQGEANILASDNFWRSILSGDPTQISKVLGPEMTAINRQGQQKKKTASEFGNRGGGTNAGMQMTDDTTRSSIDSLIADLTGKSAGALGASGSSLLNTGLSAHGQAFDMSKVIHDQQLAKWNDMFKSIAEVGLAPFTGGASLLGFGALSKPGGGGGDGTAGLSGDSLTGYS